MTQRRRSFTREDQDWFASRTGDHSPRHVDPERAAASFPGEVVVHGVHVLLWALECWASETARPVLGGIQANLLKPVLLDEPVGVDLAEDGLVRVLIDGEPVVTVKLRAEATGTPTTNPTAGDAPTRTGPHGAVDPTELVGGSGRMALGPDLAGLGERFPTLESVLGAPALAGIAGLSTLVGMVCPGPSGMLAKIDISLTGGEPDGELAYTVRRYARAFSHLVMDVGGQALAGQVSAFVERVYAAPSDDQIRAVVTPGEFAGLEPLIVGAGGGVGAVTARLLAAGGAASVLTWHRSRSAVDDVADAIEGLGGSCHTVQLDVRDPSPAIAQLAGQGWQGQHVGYFATPRIFRRYLRRYRPDDLRAFLDVYVDGLHRLVDGLVAQWPDRPLRLLNPSTVAIDEVTPDLLEYGMAKLASEQLCRWLEQRHPSLTCTSPRLPRMDTPQTQSFVDAPAEPTESVMVRELRALVHRDPARPSSG